MSPAYKVENKIIIKSYNSKGPSPASHHHYSLQPLEGFQAIHKQSEFFRKNDFLVTNSVASVSMCQPITVSGSANLLCFSDLSPSLEKHEDSNLLCYQQLRCVLQVRRRGRGLSKTLIKRGRVGDSKYAMIKRRRVWVRRAKIGSLVINKSRDMHVGRFRLICQKNLTRGLNYKFLKL